jgi:hypothetical protein
MRPGDMCRSAHQGRLRSRGPNRWSLTIQYERPGVIGALQAQRIAMTEPIDTVRLIGRKAKSEGSITIRNEWSPAGGLWLITDTPSAHAIAFSLNHASPKRSGSDLTEPPAIHKKRGGRAAAPSGDFDLEGCLLCVPPLPPADPSHAQQAYA